MKTRTLLRQLGWLLAGAFVVFCIWQVVRPLQRGPDDGKITIRFGHWQLEPGIRTAFEQLISDYEALHPNIKVEQITVPGRMYRQWGSTQLIGGTAPDLVQIGLGVEGGFFYDYFHPITTEINQPNPYNAGTPLEGVPWRNTFKDGMVTSYDPETFECYGASLFATTIRIYCNMDLLRKVTGSEQLPATFREFQAFCDQVRAYAQRTGETIEPIAGSSLTGILMLDDLFRSQMQNLSSRLNPSMDLPTENDEFYLQYLLGQWTHKEPAMQATAELMREAGALLTPGFTQIDHDQAHFRFVQGRAIMLMGFSLQATGILDQISFPIQVIRSPQPDPDDPQFGPQMRARSSEKGLRTYGGFALTRSSEHPAEALDFLRFITSAESCRRFCEISRCLPSIVGVESPESMQAFMPDTRGYPPGPTLYSTPDTRALILNSQHLLFGPEASPAHWLAKLGQELPATMRKDLVRITDARQASVHRIEAAIAAGQRLLADHPTDELLALKFQSQLETQNEMEATVHYTRLRLQQTARLKDTTTN